MATQLFDKELHTGGQRIAPGFGRLPVTRDLTLPTAFSLVIALLMVIVVMGGLLWRSRIYAPEDVLLSFLPVDLFHDGSPVALGDTILMAAPGLLCLWLLARIVRACSEKENEDVKE